MIPEDFLSYTVPCDLSAQSIINLNSSYTSHQYIAEDNFIQREKQERGQGKQGGGGRETLSAKITLVELLKRKQHLLLWFNANRFQPN